MEPAEGDGFCPRNVSLSQPRGENRPPRDISRHPLGAASQIEPRATDSPSGLSPLGASHGIRGEAARPQNGARARISQTRAL